jgi:hypothetical protein
VTGTGENAGPAEILAFWREAGPKRWYEKDGAFDDEVRRRFLGLWQEAAAGKLSAWEASDEGALALTIVLDQFPRNMFRGDPRAFATDAQRSRSRRMPLPKVLICGFSPTNGHSFTCRSSIRRTEPIRRARSSCSPPSAIRTISILR